MDCPHCGEEIDDQDLRSERDAILREFDRRLKRRQFTGECLDDEDDDGER